MSNEKINDLHIVFFAGNTQGSNTIPVVSPVYVVQKVRFFFILRPLPE